MKIARLAGFALTASLSLVSVSAFADPFLDIPGVATAEVTSVSVSGCNAAPSTSSGLGALASVGVAVFGVALLRRRR